MADEVGGVIHVEFANRGEIDTGNHPAGKRVSPEDRALYEARKWANRVSIAKDAYGQALDECRALGLSNSVIARAVGKTEAAVRMHFSRKK